MKTIAFVSLLSATALALTPAPAKAGSDGVAALGGFIGGLIVGHAINDHRSGPPSTEVVVTHRYVDRRESRHHDSRHDRHYSHDRRGYWDSVRVQVWVPGYWTTRYERGRRTNCHIPGRYEWRLERVWVPAPPRGYSHRSYSYRR